MARIGGKPRTGDMPPSRVFATRLPEVRKRHGWSQQRLAERLKELDYEIPRVTIAKIEKGQRLVKLDEAFAIAYALDVSPLHLLVPIENEPRVLLAGGEQPFEPQWARDWIRGYEPAIGQDPRMFWMERPRHEIEEVLEDARKVRIGRATTDAAFFTRQALADRGELPPITEAPDQQEDEHDA
jgi:transcriptional regulator with XRE-family HTH domain